MATAPATECVQTSRKTTGAVIYCKKGCGLIKIKGVRIELIEPEILPYKAFEPILLLGRHPFTGVHMRIRFQGGGKTPRSTPSVNPYFNNPTSFKLIGGRNASNDGDLNDEIAVVAIN